MEKKRVKQHEMDMCSGSIPKKMLLFALPVMCSSMLQLLFNAADVVVVGRWAGENSLAAVGSNAMLISLITSLFIGLSVGVSVAVGHFYGARQQTDLSQTVHTAMFMSLFCGVLMTGGKDTPDLDADASGGHEPGLCVFENLFCGYYRHDGL